MKVMMKILQKTKIDDYILYLSEVIGVDGYATYFNEASTTFANTFIKDSNGVPNTALVEAIKQVSMEILSKYASLQYRMVPIDKSYETPYKALIDSIFIEFAKKSYIIKDYTSLFTNPDFLSATKTDISHEENSNMGSNTKRKTGTDTSTVDYTDDNTSFNMSEDAPITANVGEIDTPDRKNKGEYTTTRKGEDSKIYNTTDAEIIENEENKYGEYKTVNMAYTEMYYRVIKENAIMVVIYNAINKFIYEFNRIW